MSHVLQVLYRFGWELLEICQARTFQGQLPNDLLFVRLPEYSLGNRHFPNWKSFRMLPNRNRWLCFDRVAGTSMGHHIRYVCLLRSNA